MLENRAVTRRVPEPFNDHFQFGIHLHWALDRLKGLVQQTFGAPVPEQVVKIGCVEKRHGITLTGSTIMAGGHSPPVTPAEL